MKKEVIFLPVKPEFCRKILDQSKTWEFRKVVPKKEISHIVLYSSSPEKKIKAVVEVNSIYSGSTSEVWEKTKNDSGITKKYFYEYFKGRDKAYALKLGKICPIIPISPNLIDIKVPQSFFYLNKEKMDIIHQFKQNRVFFGGIHGIGKSTLINSLKQIIPDSEHLICSQIIKYNASILDVKTIDTNQDILVKEIERLGSHKKNIFIDGHFSLIQQNQPKEVPISTFAKLKICSIILLHGSVSKLADRLSKTNREKISKTTLEALQEMEIKQANIVAKLLGIPIYLIDVFSSADSTASQILSDLSKNK